MLNNIFVQAQGIRGLIFASGTDDIFVDGNVHWGLLEGPAFTEDFFVKRTNWRSFPDRAKPSGWMDHDIFADPKLNRLTADPNADFDPSLQKSSPAINAGVPIPTEWFDPLRNRDKEKPDIGALPLGEPAEPVGLPSAGASK